MDIHFEFRKKMKKQIIFILIIISNFSYSQSDTLFKPNIQLRGKISSFFIIEDIFFRNANLGIEYRFAKNHSIGFDYVYFRFRYQNDSIVNGIEYSGGYNSYSRRDYFIIDYRYYPFQKHNIKTGYDFYVNPFMKIGKRKIWNDTPKDYITEHNFEGIFDQKANYIDNGIAVGFKSSNIGTKNRWFFDLNIGVIYRTNFIKFENGYDFGTNLPYSRNNTIENEWVPHMRINFCYKILQF